MGVLYLDRRGLDVSLRDGRVRIAAGDGKPRFVPCASLDHVVVAASMDLPANLLAALSERGVAVSIVRPRHGRVGAVLCGNPHADTAIRLAQYRAHCDAATRIAIARQVVAAKRVAQLRLLARMLRMRPDLRLPLTHAMAGLRGVDLDAVTGIETLLGCEGAAARSYFSGFKTAFAGSLEFHTRQRRPPPDAVNAALSLGYTLLHGRAVQAVLACGLDPMLGFLHAPARGRESLVCDLVEPLRPALDRMVWRLFAERVLTSAHFRRDGNACLLGKQGRSLFYGHVEAALKPVQRLLRRHAMRLRRHLLDTASAGDTSPSPRHAWPVAREGL